MTVRNLTFIFYLICLITILPISELSGQQVNNQLKCKAESTKADFLGKTVEVRSLAGDLKSLEIRNKEKFRKNRKKPENLSIKRNVSRAVFPELEHQGDDPIRQWTAGNGRVIEPKVNIDGIGDFGSPHDPTGDIGLNYFVQAVNVTHVGIFSKEGELVLEFPMNQLWSSLGAQSFGDPIVIFDDIEERWFITEFTGPSNLLIAVSETSDPLGSYYAYSFSTPNFPDYPKYAIWGDYLVVTTNEQGGFRLHQYFLDKPALIAGEADVTMQRVEITGSTGTETGFFVSTPVDADGKILPEESTPIALRLNDSSWGMSSQDQVELYKFNIDFDNPANTSFENISIPTTPFDSYPCSVFTGGFSCIPQLNGGGLDGIPENIMNVPKYRNFGTHESIVLTFITDVTDGNNLSGIRWMELRRNALSDWFLYQEGTFAPDDGLHRFMGSIALDNKGNIGLGYNVSGVNSYAGVRYTGRNVNDPLGEMTVEEYEVVAGKNPIFSGGRFGDYAQMSVDPVDGSTFWYTTEYAGTGNQVTATRIVAFELRKDSIDLALSAVEPGTGTNYGMEETITLQVSNNGLKPIKDFIISYDFEGNYIEEFLSIEELLPDSVLRHTFSTKFDLSEKKEYAMNAQVTHPLDERTFNDTLQHMIHHIYQFNASIEANAIETSCSDQLEVMTVIENLGAETIQHLELQISTNNEVLDTIDWFGNLFFQNAVTFPFNITLETGGINQIDIEIISINGQEDELALDNISSFGVDFKSSNEILVLKITTDAFPEETSWEIRDLDSILLYSGGPYEEGKSTYWEYFCLDTVACYTFTIKDLSGDGICCQAGLGRYSIEMGSGEKVFEAFGNFGFEREHAFCGSGFICNLTADIETIDDSGAGDGTIMINAQNGIEPYSYSIDNGNTFQSTPLFENLVAANYKIQLIDKSGVCLHKETITINLETGIEDIDNKIGSLKIMPNPNDGFFSFEYTSKVAQQDNFIEVQLIDATGLIIQSRKTGKFNDTFKGEFSLLEYPSGLYLFRVISSTGSVIKKVMKR
jgi:hypothetical protein